MPEQGEGSSSTVIEIEAPEYLKEGQNFFDQEPFRGIIVKLVTEGEGELDAKIVRNLLFNSSLYRKKTVYFASEIGHLIHYLAKREKIPPGDERKRFREKYVEVATKLQEKLHVYPHLGDYVSTRPPAYYKHNGDYEPTAPTAKYLPKRTYPAWLTEEFRIRRLEKRQVLLGIQDIFPVQFTGNQTERVRASGKSAGARKWKILKAAELMK